MAGNENVVAAGLHRLQPVPQVIANCETHHCFVVLWNFAENRTQTSPEKLYFVLKLVQRKMGGDGGSIPKRAELVKTSKRGEQADKDMERDAKWSHCAITQRELARPIVACDLGKLYNKESVLEYLLDKSICDSASHIRSLKDVTVLNLTENTGYDEKCRELAGHFDTMASKYTCPVVGLEMNGKYRFCFIRTCGCVMSEKALKEVPTEVCHKCGKTFMDDDVVVLNGNEEDVRRQALLMEERRFKAKLAKKSKKEKKSSKADCLNRSDIVENNKRSGNETETKGQSKSDTMPSKKRKSELSDSRAKNSTSTLGPEFKKTVAKDPKATKVFKSLFTSSESAKNRPNHKVSNWVTYNPYHL